QQPHKRQTTRIIRYDARYRVLIVALPQRQQFRAAIVYPEQPDASALQRPHLVWQEIEQQPPGRQPRWQTVGIGQARPAIPCEISVHWPFTDAVMGRVVVAVDGQREHAFKLRQAKAGTFFRLTLATFVDVTESRATQFVHDAHQCADQPLDRAMLLRVTLGANFRGDPMSLQPALDALGLVLRPLIVFEGFGFAVDRPMHAAEGALFQPIRFWQAGMGEAGCNRDGGCGLNGDREAWNDPTVNIDGHGEVRPADDGAVGFTDQQDIAGRAVDLHPLPRRGCAGMRTREQAERARRLRAFTPPG